MTQLKITFEKSCIKVLFRENIYLKNLKKKSKRENNPFNLMAWNTFSSDSIIQDFQNSVFQETGKSEYDVL